MHKASMIFLLTSLYGLLGNTSYASTPGLDVLSYHLELEPDLNKASIKGRVVITFSLAAEGQSITLDAGDLQITQVEGTSVKSFKKEGSKLKIVLSETQQNKQQITISYHGSPKRGLLFNVELGQAHTVYFTSAWMVCNDNPADRASFSLNILVPAGKQCIASGELVGTEKRGAQNLYKWRQKYETPAYTYGLVIGTFNHLKDQVESVQLNYYSAEQSEAELQKIFLETGEIIQFFEEKSGIPYPQNRYSQVLIGSNYQEMSGLAVFNTSYAAAVLKDSSEIHLTAHELAHQWWGNRITCQDFGHFWLNEAFAVYMASAFSEYKFGQQKYQSDIALYKGIYKDLVKRGKDKPLVFSKWNPSRDNRNVVYYKGAYVLHLLREKVGPEAFWQGIRLYSQRYVEKSVQTKDFQLVMEEASQMSLDPFFNTWVY